MSWLAHLFCIWLLLNMSVCALRLERAYRRAA